ncbi:MAG: HAMP domain-containing histidine kinase [Chloroflexi bacterium]|nr:MAG: HAMP domain-containing histidine kinase [Chloroflexota bacterium]
MNRLWLRLTLAFIVVTLVAVGAVALLADWNASTEFRAYVSNQDVLAQRELADQLGYFYQQHGSWDGIGSAFAPFGPSGVRRPPRGNFRGVRPGPAPLIADASGKVVYDPTGQRTGSTLDARERQACLPVLARGAVVGCVELNENMVGLITASEQAFLDQLRNTLGIAALAAGGLGILLGLLISRTLAAPLAELAGAARAFGAHDWSRRVNVRGIAQTAEISAVAHAFNDMADALQDAETLRRNLMADVAHELRTPLTVLQGNLRALLDGVYPLERGEIATLYDETRLLSRLVDDLRQLALAEAGQLPLNQQALDARALALATLNTFGAAAEECGLTLQSDMPANLPLVCADPGRLAQVLQNLLSNALRHTPSGGQIRLSASPASSDRGPVVYFAVVDTGEGIAAADLPHIFDRFYRADRSRTPRGGTGLGLAIAKSFVEAMSGTIGVASSPGQGSRFWFSLPCA